MNQDGAITLATAIDTSGFDKGIKRLEEDIVGFTDDAIKRTGELAAQLTEMPTGVSVDIDVTDAEAALAVERDLNEIMSRNVWAMQDIGRQKEALDDIIAKATEVQAEGNEESAKAIEAAEREKKALSDLENAHKRVIKEAENQQKALKKVTQQMSVGERVTLALRSGFSSMRQLTRELQAEMVSLEASGQRNSARFKELSEGSARLADAMADARAQTNILANDNAGFAGVLSAMSGVAGGMSAVSGAMTLFGSESEDLQRIMMRLQALMAITNGLQQVSVMLNKDSAASLVLLNGVKSIWAKITGANNALAAEETAITQTNTAAKAEEATATEADTTAETQNTASVEANNVARQQNSQIISQNVGVKTADTKATEGQSAAQNTLTTATTKTTVAVRALKAVMKTTVIFAIVGAVMWLISAISDLLTKLNGTEKAIKAVEAAVDSSLEAYAKAKTEIGSYTKKLEQANLTKEEEKQLCDELNRKYGEQLGYHKTQAEWLNTLKERGDVYCESIKRQAKAQALLNAYTDAYIRLLQLEEKQRQYNQKSKWQQLWSSSPADDLKDAQEEMKYLEAEWEKVNRESQEFAANNDLGFHADPEAAKGNSSFDPKKAAEQVLKAYKDYADYVEKYIRQTNDAVSQANIQYMRDGLNKDLLQSESNFKRLIKEWESQFNEFGQALKQRQKEIFMSKEGATEEMWRNSADGRKADDDWLKEALSQNEQLAKQYYAHIERLERESVLERQRIQQKYTDSLVEQYGSAEEQAELLERRFLESFTNLSDNDPLWQYFDEAEKQLNQKIANIRVEELKKQMNWEDVFGDLETLATPALESVKSRLQEIIKTQKDLSPEAMKTLVDAVQKIEAETNRRNPFDYLSRSAKNLSKATKDVEIAQRLYNEALASGNEKLIESAERHLEDAQNKRQKALADLTKSLQGAVQTANEFLDITQGVFGMFEQFGLEIPQELKGFAEGIGDVVNSIAEIDFTQPLSVIKGAVGVIGGMAKAVGSLFNHDSRREKEIQRIQKQIDKLQKSYDQLGKSIDNAYSKDATKLIKTQNEMLEQQKSLIQKQISEEESKKHTDNAKIEEYKSTLQEINELIEENNQKAQDAIFGSDLKNAIESFASAYADAWASNENRTKSAKNVVRDMMRQMVQESIKAAIQSSNAMEQIRQKLEEFYSDNILEDWQQQEIYRMAEDLQKELDNKFGWADSLMKDSNFQQGGSSGGFQAMSEDTAEQLNGRFTAMAVSQERISSTLDEMFTSVDIGFSDVRTGLDEIQNINLLQLQQLESINKNTKLLNDTNEHLERIERNTKDL